METFTSLNNELNRIAKMYGNDMKNLLGRNDAFATIRETRGALYTAITELFAPSKLLYDEIKDQQGEFINLMLVKLNEMEVLGTMDEAIPTDVNFLDIFDSDKVDEYLQDIVSEFKEKAHYDLYLCKTEEDVNKFRDYYVPDELLCTFDNINGRLGSKYIFWAVKDNVDEIKREETPIRDGAYGTSVISLQFDKRNGILSIKNRYNHTVSNPDATLNNSLENISVGLTRKFAQIGLAPTNNYKNKLLLTNYIQDNKGKLYKYNYTINDIYFCPNNVVLNKDGIATQYVINEDVFLDCYVLNISKKRGQSLKCVAGINDCFEDAFKNINNIVKKSLPNDETEYLIYVNNKTEPVSIVVNKNNRIVEYSNPHIENVGDNFLFNNTTLRKISLPNVKTVGNNFLSNANVPEVDMPLVEKIGDNFLVNSSILKFNAENLQEVGNNFLPNAPLTEFNSSKLIKVGNNFLPNALLTEFDSSNLVGEIGDNFLRNSNLKSFVSNNITKVGDSFLEKSQDLECIEMNGLEAVGNGFIRKNKKLTSVNFPKVKSVEDEFLNENEILENITLNNLETCGFGFLSNNIKLVKINFPKLSNVKSGFISSNEIIEEAYLDNLESCGSGFLRFNKRLKKLSLNKSKNIGDAFMTCNNCLEKLELNNAISIGYQFLYNNNTLEELSFPNLKVIQHGFLMNNEKLKKLQIDNVIKIGHSFLINNLNLTILNCEKLEQLEHSILTKNNKLEVFNAPNLQRIIPCRFLPEAKKLNYFNAGQFTDKLKEVCGISVDEEQELKPEQSKYSTKTKLSSENLINNVSNKSNSKES